MACVVPDFLLAEAAIIVWVSCFLQALHSAQDIFLSYRTVCIDVCTRMQMVLVRAWSVNNIALFEYRCYLLS